MVMQILAMIFVSVVAAKGSECSNETRDRMISSLAPGEVVEDYRSGIGYRLGKDGKVEEFKLVA